MPSSPALYICQKCTRHKWIVRATFRLILEKTWPIPFVPAFATRIVAWGYLHWFAHRAFSAKFFLD